MRWSDIAGCLRRDFVVKAEKYGQLVGVLKDVGTTDPQELQALLQKGGSVLVLTAEVGDAALLAKDSAQTVASGPVDVVAEGRLASLRQTFEVAKLEKVELERVARALATRARKLRERSMPAG